MSAIVFTVPHKVLTIIQHIHMRIYIPTKCAKFGPYGLTAINPNPDGSLYAFLYCPSDYGILVFLREFINKINKFENHIQCSQCPTISLCLTPSLQCPTKFLQKSNTHAHLHHHQMRKILFIWFNDDGTFNNQHFHTMDIFECEFTQPDFLQQGWRGY